MHSFQLKVTDNYEELSVVTAERILKTIKTYPDGLYCFAGGDTPVKTLQLLAAAHQAGEVDLTKAYYIELDEWVGLPKENRGSCLSYLKRNLFDLVDMPEDHIHYFDATTAEIEKECQYADEYIKQHGGITLSLLGVGQNGHLGFNEPFCDFESNAHLVDLAEDTKIIGQKYFDAPIELSQGISLGIKELMESEVLIVQASGEKKQKAIAQLLSGTITNEWPVTVINNHKNCFVIIDELSAGESM